MGATTSPAPGPPQPPSHVRAACTRATGPFPPAPLKRSRCPVRRRPCCRLPPARGPLGRVIIPISIQQGACAPDTPGRGGGQAARSSVGRFLALPRQRGPHTPFKPPGRLLHAPGPAPVVHPPAPGCWGGPLAAKGSALRRLPRRNLHACLLSTPSGPGGARSRCLSPACARMASISSSCSGRCRCMGDACGLHTHGHTDDAIAGSLLGAAVDAVSAA